MSEAKQLKEAVRDDFDGFETGEYYDECLASQTLEMSDLMRRYGADQRDVSVPAIDKAA